MKLVVIENAQVAELILEKLNVSPSCEIKKEVTL